MSFNESAVLVVSRLDCSTLEWFHGQRRALAAARGEPQPGGSEDTRRWLAERPDALVEEPSGPGEWVPVLHRYLDGVASEALERVLVEVGVIRAVGFRPGDSAG